MSCSQHVPSRVTPYNRVLRIPCVLLLLYLNPINPAFPVVGNGVYTLDRFCIMAGKVVFQTRRMPIEVCCVCYLHKGTIRHNTTDQHISMCVQIGTSNLCV